MVIIIETRRGARNKKFVGHDLARPMLVGATIQTGWGTIGQNVRRVDSNKA